MSPTRTVLPRDTPSRSYPLAWNPKHTPRCSIEGSIPLSDPNSESLSPARTLHGRGLACQLRIKTPQSVCGPPSARPRYDAPPRYHGDPCPDPKGPGPAETGRLRVCLQLWGPGLKLTSGRRTRLPLHAQPSGSCSLNACVGEKGSPGSRRLPRILCGCSFPIQKASLQVHAGLCA